MRESPTFDNEDLWFPAHLSAGDSFTRPVSPDGTATITDAPFDDGIGLPRRRTPSTARRRRSTVGGVKASSWIWLTVWGAAALGIATYAARKEIATELVQSWLKGQGVAVQLRFDTLSLGHATGSFVVGDQAKPDFATRHFDTDYTLNLFARGGQPPARLKSVHLDQVTAHLTYKDGRLSFGTFDRLLRAPGEAPRDVTIDHATVAVDGDYGHVAGTGGATFHDGRLSYLTLKLPPALLKGTKLDGDFGGSDVLVHAVTGNQLQVETRLEASQLNLHDGQVVEGAAPHSVTLGDARLNVSGRLPYAEGHVSGPVSATVTVDAKTLGGKSIDVTGLAARVVLDGTIKGGVYGGRTDINASAGQWRQAGHDLRDVTIKARGLDTHISMHAVTASGAADVAAGALSHGGTKIQGARLHASHMTVSADANGIQTHFDGQADIGRIAAGDLALNQVSGPTSGDIHSDTSGGWEADLQGDATGQGSYTGLSGLSRGRRGGDQLAALDRGLDHFAFRAKGVSLSAGAGGYEWRLGAPATADLAGGGTATLTPLKPQPLISTREAGGFNLAIIGTGLPHVTLAVTGMRPTARGLSGNYDFNGEFSTAALSGFKLDARGRLSLGAGLDVSLSQPAVFSARSVDAGVALEHLSGIFAAGDNVLHIDSANWTLNGSFRTLSFDAPTLRLAMNGGQGHYKATGSGFDLRLDSGAVSDTLTGEARRFNAVVLGGQLKRDDGALSGHFTVATPRNGKPQPIGGFDVSANDVRLHSADLDFAPGGLQPADLSPQADGLRNVTGHARFDGDIHWNGRQTASTGTLKLDGLSFGGAMASGRNLNGTIDFTSLSPLQSRPGQVLSLDHLDIGLPLDQVSLPVEVEDDLVAITDGRAETAGGSIRLESASLPLSRHLAGQGTVAFDGLDFGKLIASTRLGGSLTLEGKLSGRVPFAILGGHVNFGGGRIQADAPGMLAVTRAAVTGLSADGTVTAEGEAHAATVPTGSQPFDDLSYQALEHLRYDSLDATLDGDVAHLHLRGQSAPPQPQSPRISVEDYLSGAWVKKPLALPSGTPVDLHLDVSLEGLR